MGILALEILTIWSLIAFVTGIALGTVIQKGERVHQDEFLTVLFSRLEAMQASR